MHMFWTTIINLALESMLRPRLVGNVVPVLSGCNNMEVCVTNVWRLYTICDRKVRSIELSKGQRRMEVTKPRFKIFQLSRTNIKINKFKDNNILF